MALPGAGKRLKPPKGKGVKWRDISAQSSEILLSQYNPDNPSGVNMLTQTTGYAAAGFAFGGPIGGVIGGVVGGVFSLFSASAREKEELRKKREYLYQYGEAKQRVDTQFVEGRTQQLSRLGTGVRADVRQIEKYLHQSLGAEISSVQRPVRTLSFSQTGRMGKIQSSQYEKLLLAQSKIVSDKTTATLSGRKKALRNIEEWREEIEGADTEVKAAWRTEEWGVKNLDKAYKSSEAYDIAKDKGRTERIRRQLEG